jgi:HAE1 family hydrophobic/amphiphilic exporter-1/multidrug efflux pump
MTSLAFILGVVPLVFSTGAGAGARHSAGTGVMGGMLAATFLAIFFIPWFYHLIVDRKLSEPRSKQEVEDEARRHREISVRTVHGAHHHPVTRSDGDV